MINSFTSGTQTVANNGIVLFSSDRVKTKSCNSCCGWLSHDIGSGTFTITKPGIYEVSFNGVLGSSATATTNANFSISSSGESLPGTTMIANIESGTQESIACSTLVKNPCGASTTITIENLSGSDILVTQPNIVIKRCS